MNPEIKAMSDEFNEQLRLLSIRCVNLALERDRARAEAADLTKRLEEQRRAYGPCAVDTKGEVHA